ncbi:flavin monoamine oxidase family protein [Janthinobacterium sp. CG_S6]|uniref:flavin monoamine oxidase family protein n=1 Tax=Janthinobacterium sp. CG_S6 TaxID=3071707 RepID=UPI002E04C8EE|nr:oxygen-dependent protoporphyrinogen oxidase [Janthinobacterium sp. CG_S6]
MVFGEQFNGGAAAPPSRSSRIAVVGAGPSGLTAADSLRRLGYDNVTVFEKSERVGGKVHSLRRGAAVAELGAVLASTECKLVLGLADRYGIPYAPYAVGQNILDEHGGRHAGAAFLASRYSADEIASAVRHYAAALERFGAVGQNGFASLPSDLYLPFDQFAAKHGFTAVAEQARSALIGFGYGYYDSTPALYFMKLIGWLLKPGGPNGLEPGAFYMFPNGFQGIWDALAGDLDVQLGADVTAVARDARRAGGPLQVTVNGSRQYEFDALIVSAPLNVVGHFLRLDEEEEALFSQVRSHRYVVNLFSATGLATGEFLFFHGNAHAARANHVNAWSNRDPSVPAYIGWQLADWAATLDQVNATLAQDVAAQGGQFGALALRREWDYFPHVGSAALRDGFYERVEALQGKDQLFYVGATLSFETVEHSARYAEELVNSRFPAVHAHARRA